MLCVDACFEGEWMFIKRNLYQQLLSWKSETKGSKALLVEGARRVGKSTLAETFGRNEYSSSIVVDFNKAPRSVLENYENLSNLDIFFQTLSLAYNTRLFRRNSLIIFDEVQKFPRAREAIKYLVQDGRYDYIETGSLISIKENVRDITIPSEERVVRMYPVDFEEFASVLGEDLLLEYVRDCYSKKIPLRQEYHAKAMHLFREYLLVGGMPQSIVAYVENDRDFASCDVEKRDILQLYKDDIKKAANRYQSKVSAVFENIPAFLSTHEKKIVLSRMGDNGQVFSRFDDPLYWLGDSMMCNLCYRCTDPNVGFALTKDPSSVKCYLGDTGLLVSLAFDENALATNRLYKSIMDGKLSLNEGMLYENMMAQMLTSYGKKLYFYTQYNDAKHRNDIEIDFLLSNEDKLNFKVYPVEVKSSTNYTAISLGRFREKFGKRICRSVVIHPKNYSEEGDIIKIPPYMLFCVFGNRAESSVLP